MVRKEWKKSKKKTSSEKKIIKSNVRNLKKNHLANILAIYNLPLKLTCRFKNSYEIEKISAIIDCVRFEWEGKIFENVKEVFWFCLV